MTLMVIFLAYGGTMLLVAGIENASLTSTFQWIMAGAPGQAPGSNTTGGNGNTTGPQTTTGTPPGSVVFVGNPFLGA